VASFVLLPFYTAPANLDPADYGVNELLSQSIAVLGYLAGINMTAAMARHYFDSADARHRRLVVSTTLWSVLLASLALGGVLALFAAPLGRLVADRPDMPDLVLMTLGILVLQLLREVYWRYLQTEERSTAFAVFAVSKTVVEVALQLFLMGVLRRGLRGFFEAVLLGEALSVLALAVTLAPRTGFGFSGPLFRQLALYALPLVPNGILQFVLHQSNRYILDHLQGEDAVGRYSFAFKLGQIPFFLVLTPFLMVWYPFVFSVGDEARQKELIARIATWFLALVAALSLGVSLLAPELARLMAGQPGFDAAWPAIPLVCLGYWLWGAFQMAQTGFYVRKRTGSLPWLTGAAAAVIVAANYALIPPLGWLGAAWATVIAFALLVVLTARAGRGVFAVEFAWGRMLSPVVAGAAAFGLGVYAVPADLGMLGIVPAGTVAVKAVLGAAWLAWMWFGWMTGEERAGVAEAVGKLRRRRAAG
jgi:O-antigen/teichoic acid export membrane protein